MHTSTDHFISTAVVAQSGYSQLVAKTDDGSALAFSCPSQGVPGGLRVFFYPNLKVVPTAVDLAEPHRLGVLALRSANNISPHAFEHKFSGVRSFKSYVSKLYHNIEVKIVLADGSLERISGTVATKTEVDKLQAECGL